MSGVAGAVMAPEKAAAPQEKGELRLTTGKMWNARRTLSTNRLMTDDGRA